MVFGEIYPHLFIEFFEKTTSNYDKIIMEPTWEFSKLQFMQSWIAGLLEVASQMVISIHVSHEGITQYDVIFYENC